MSYHGSLAMSEPQQVQLILGSEKHRSNICPLISWMGGYFSGGLETCTEENYIHLYYTQKKKKIDSILLRKISSYALVPN